MSALSQFSSLINDLSCFSKETSTTCLINPFCTHCSNVFQSREIALGFAGTATNDNSSNSFIVTFSFSLSFCINQTETAFNIHSLYKAFASFHISLTCENTHSTIIFLPSW